MREDGIKCCTECKEDKPTTEYTLKKGSPFGVRTKCKSCEIIIRRDKAGIAKEKRRLAKLNPDLVKSKHASIVKYREKKKSCPIFKHITKIRNLTRRSLQGAYWRKNGCNPEYLGCDRDTLRHHFESKFVGGMTWDNHGEWHIDHIIPLSSATTIEELNELAHYTNLQPLWEIDNKIKKNTRV